MKIGVDSDGKEFFRFEAPNHLCGGSIERTEKGWRATIVINTDPDVRITAEDQLAHMAAYKAIGKWLGQA